MSLLWGLSSCVITSQDCNREVTPLLNKKQCLYCSHTVWKPGGPDDDVPCPAPLAGVIDPGAGQALCPRLCCVLLLEQGSPTLWNQLVTTMLPVTSPPGSAEGANSNSGFEWQSDWLIWLRGQTASSQQSIGNWIPGVANLKPSSLRKALGKGGLKLTGLELEKKHV